MMQVTSFFLSLFIFTAAQASVENCHFVPRSASQSVFSAFDSRVVGLANCQKAFPSLNAFYVGKFNTLNEKSARQFVDDVAKIVDGTAKTSLVKWESKQPLELRQMIVETQSPPNPSRPRVDVMSHYSFIKKAADGSYLVFVTTLDPKTFAQSKRILEASNRRLSADDQFAANVLN